MSTIAAVIGRILIALLFVVSGIMKLLNPGPAADMLAAVNMSPALTIPAALFEVVVGLALALGMMTRLASLLLAGFTVLTIILFHNQFNDPAQIPSILLHVALVGGLLGVFAHSQIWWSFDSMRRQRREELAARSAEERAHDAELRAAKAEGLAHGRGDGLTTARTDGTVVETRPVTRKRSWF